MAWYARTIFNPPEAAYIVVGYLSTRVSWKCQSQSLLRLRLLLTRIERDPTKKTTTTDGGFIKITKIREPITGRHHRPISQTITSTPGRVVWVII